MVPRSTCILRSYTYRMVVFLFVNRAPLHFPRSSDRRLIANDECSSEVRRGMYTRTRIHTRILHTNWYTEKVGNDTTRYSTLSRLGFSAKPLNYQG